MFDWSDLKYFLAVAREGSSLAAARALRVNQSTVHRRLLELEKRLGCPLVERRPSGHRLTEYGKELQPYAECVEQAANALRRHAETFDKDMRGTVRLTCATTIAHRLMRSELLDKFQKRYPGIKIELLMIDRVLDLSIVGICWVSAWLITSPNGHVLIDTLYGPFTGQMLGNIRATGFDPKDIKLVVVTHGHFDHAGGIGQLKSELAPGTRFAMTQEGWREGAEDSVSHPRFPWKMIEPDIVLTDGQTIAVGDVAIQAFETPGHSMGTASFAFDARDGARTYRAFTVGGLGLNRIRGPEQVEAFIASLKRIRTLTQDGARPVELHLTTHGFATGLNEAKDRLKTRKAGDPHPLVDLPGFRRQLDDFQAGAEKRLVVERQKKAK
jgi:metallo-beta-lactamase class B